MTKKILFLTLLFAFSATSFISAQKSGLEIMKDYEEEIKIKDMKTDMELVIISKSGRTQNRLLVQEIKASEECHNCYNSIIRFLKPTDVKNTAVLTLEYGDRDDDQWLYLPALQRSRRISASNRKDRFVGTEISYEDISNNLSENLEDYAYKSLGTKVVNGEECFQIEATPTSEEEIKASGYSKRIISITTKHYVIVNTQFFDKSGKSLKELNGSDIRKVPGTDNEYRAYKIDIVNHQTGNKTKVTYSNIEIDKGLDSELFTKRNLEKES